MSWEDPLRWIVSAFLLIPIVELVLLVHIGERIGLAATLILILVTGVVGAALARQQGLATLRRATSTLGHGRLPALELAEGVGLLVAAALLVTPGVITDVVGFALLLPAPRRAAARRVMDWLRGRVVVQAASGVRPGPGWGRVEPERRWERSDAPDPDRVIIDVEVPRSEDRDG